MISTGLIRQFAILMILQGFHGFSQEPPSREEAFHSQIQSIYSFAPHELSREQIHEKSKELDQFWAMVTKDKATYLPLLRKELPDLRNSTFFGFDGSQLLLGLSTAPGDLRTALAAITRVDLRDIDHAEFLRVVHRLGTNGLDTSEAAFRVLGFPAFKAFIPQHSLTLGQNYSFIYLLFRMEERTFLPALQERIKSESNEAGQKSLLLALWYTCTAESRQAISAFAEDASKPEGPRTYAQELLARPAPKPGNLDSPKVLKLRAQRRTALSSISDEALLDFDNLTVKIIKG